MRRDEKWIGVGTCILFGLIYLVSFFGLPHVYQGEALGWMAYFLTYPLRVFWSPDDLSGQLVRIFYVLIYGTFVYMLAGVPIGFLVVGFRRLVRWLNHEKWISVL